MDKKYLLSMVDHTLLSTTATESEIIALCGDALRFGTASVCIPPCRVRAAADYLAGRLPVGTVIGFPNGCNKPSVKLFEAAEAIDDGADELDTVINQGFLREKNFAAVADELTRLRAVCGGKLLKVIIETCLLNETEKIEMCRIVTSCGADFIKTSTGFSKGGATPEDVRLLAANVGKNVRVKAAGGIKTWEDAEALAAAGASRLGTSRLVNLMKQE